MKPMKLILTFLALAAIAVGCKPSEKEATSGQIEKVAKTTKEAAQDVKDYPYAKKAEFVAAMQSQLDEINRDLDQVAAKIEKSSEAAKSETQPKLQALRDQADKLTQQLNEASNATESTWDDVKAGFTKGYQGLKNGFNEVRQWASDTIAP